MKILPDPFAAKAVTRDTCLLSGVDARALARIGGVDNDTRKAMQSLNA